VINKDGTNFRLPLPLYSVEAQGRTLEELEWVYQQPNPVKASQSFDKVVVQADGTVTEKIALDE
jgi:hypothetical protein